MTTAGLVDDMLSLGDLPEEVREQCADHARWYAARNAEDGPQARPSEWSLAGAMVCVRNTFLAVGIAVGTQRGVSDVDKLKERLELERSRVADLQVVADAGYELARAQARATEVQALLLSQPAYSTAVTERLPRQRAGES